jgi:TonB-dependent receptor
VNKYLLSLLLMLPFSFVVAQDETEEEVEDVVVLGVKQSLIDAIELKRSKVGVTEAITAEDIGKFPDQNLAESLARISGVTIDRSNVEGSRVNVRGLGYQFNLVTLNGRSMPTVAGQYEHGRGFDFGDISSHGVSAVEVYKSSNAILPSGGIGATINMITTKPLVAGDAASFSVRTVADTKVEIGDELTPEFDFLFSRDSELVFGDYSLPIGLALSGSHQERHNREVGTNEITWVPGGYGLTTTNVTGTGRSDGVVFTPEIVGFKAKDNERLRQNFQATFQIQLTDKAVLTLDNTFSSLEFETTGRQKSSYWAGWDIDSYVVNDHGAMISATIPEGVANGDGNAMDNNFMYGDSVKRNKSQGANLDIQMTDNFNLTIDHHESTSASMNNGDNVLIYSNGGWDGCLGAGGQCGA